MEISSTNTNTGHGFSSYARQHPGQIWSTAALLAVGTFLVVLYFLGTFGNGYELRHIIFRQFINTTPLNFSIGSKTCYLEAGQTLVVKYQAKVERGGLTLLVRGFRNTLPGETVNSLHVQNTGSGTFRTKVPTAGFYELRCFGSPDGNGYDVNYTLHWWEE